MTTVESKSLISFFVLATIFALPSYILVGLTSNGFILSPELAFSFVPLATLSPLLAALILTFREGGWAEVKALLWRTFDFKRTKNKLWLAVALLLPAIIVSFAWIAATFLGLELLPAEIPLIAIPLMFVIFFSMSLFEELGWMGRAYEPMEKKWGAIKSALILGFILSLFHIPLYYFLLDDPIIMVVNILFPAALRVTTVWIYNNAGKSVFAATIFHAMYNLCYAIFDVNIVVATTLLVIAALGVVILERRR